MYFQNEIKKMKKIFDNFLWIHPADGWFNLHLHNLQYSILGNQHQC